MVISHTEHYRNQNGDLVGWSSTVREIDELAKVFDKVIHAGCFYHGIAPQGLAGYTSTKVEFVPLPSYGGTGLKKLSVIYTAPVIISRVFRQLSRATHFQFRAPTAMGVYLIPLLSWFTAKKGWYKYAGNWVQESPPLSYRFQRCFLTRWQKRKVTINGLWPHQRSHCITFENPCLSDEDLEEGRIEISSKKFNSPYTLCFVGRLDESKGADVFLEALKLLDGNQRLHNVYLVGDGERRKVYEAMVNSVSFNVHFPGFVQRDALFAVLKRSHVLVLPSKSEGFPKVIAEGWNFGCVPVVTDVSAISQYVYHQQNGFTLDSSNRNSKFLSALLNEVIVETDFNLVAKRGYEMAKKFTYSAYLRHLDESVLSSKEKS